MSFLGKKWEIKSENFQKLIETKKSLDKEEEFHDPTLFQDMGKALSRIDKALKNNERIMIFGDYDADGISAAAILIHIFQKLEANVSYRLPNRVEDGYGLSEKFIDEFFDKKVDLIITVDCGISCKEPIRKAKENGMDTIITDHHTIPRDLPTEAIAILHPGQSGYPFGELTGAGVALKLTHALIQKYFPQKNHESLLNEFLDLASIGTVGDLGPLKGENRAIVKRGLKAIKNTKYPGLAYLIKSANIPPGKQLDTTHLGFRIIPRINAAGRIDDPYLSLQLLLQKEDTEKTQQLSQKLEKLNIGRQEMTEKAFKEAQTRFSQQESCPETPNLPFILIEQDTDWHVGILGLVAGKLSEKFNRPGIIFRDMGDILTGSARSIPQFNIIEAVTACGNLLESFGGHEQAAGLSIKKSNLSQFKKQIRAYAEEKLKNKDLAPLLEIDCELTSNEIGFPLLDAIEKFEPFGIGNERPVFLIRDVEPNFIDKIGKEGEHLKFQANLGDKTMKSIAFRLGFFTDTLRKHRKIDIACHIEKHEWNGHESIQIQALDFRVKER